MSSSLKILFMASTMLASMTRLATAWRPSPVLMGGRRLRSFSMQAGAGEGEKQELGFVGLGYMGAGMVRRLLGGGHRVVVWNRSADKSAKLKSEYPELVTVAATPKEVAEKTAVTFSMLSTPEAARAVFYGPTGVLEGMGPGKGLVDCATLEVSDMVEFGQAVAAKGGRFLEAPVSGSKVPAETGQLIFLMGGDKSLADDVAPQLSLMGKAAHFLGDTGKGSEMKLVVNMIMGSMMASLGEGINLAKSTGLDPSALVTVLGQGAMACGMFAIKGPKMIADDHVPNFPLKHQTKDLAFAVRLAEQAGADVPVARAATATFQQVLGQAGELDFSAVVKATEKKK